VSSIKVEVLNGNLEKALRSFKKKIKDTKLMVEIKDRQFFEKPSLSKRRKKQKAIARNKFINQQNKDSY